MLNGGIFNVDIIYGEGRHSLTKSCLAKDAMRRQPPVGNVELAVNRLQRFDPVTLQH